MENWTVDTSSHVESGNPQLVLDPLLFKTAGLHEYADSVPLKEVAGALSDLADGLDLTSQELAAKGSKVTWLLIRADPGSLYATITPVGEGPFVDYVATETSRRVTEAIDQATRGMEISGLLPARAAAGIKRLVSRISSGSLGETTISRGEHSVTIGSQASTAEPLTVRITSEYGSIEGELIGVKYGASPFMTVRDRITGAEVNCHFSTAVLDESRINGALRKRIVLSGSASLDANGEIRAIQNADQLFAFPDQSELAQPDDLAGLVPDITSGVSSERWISSARD